MDFLFVNTEELSALSGLPYIQQVTYLLGIRPYMDRKTFMVGIKRRISHQSLSEALYVEPHQGLKSGSPSRQQVRRILKSLERAGLIQIKSSEMHLILKCLLANSDFSVQNKPDTKPTQQTDTKQAVKNHNKSMYCEDNIQQADPGKTVKADTPHNSENNYIFLGEPFEKFWALYPNKNGKQKAWEQFQRLNPDQALLCGLFEALHQQIATSKQLEAQGFWTPNWKYPANWLVQRGWEDEIQVKEHRYATHSKHSTKSSSYDFLWESCKSGLDFQSAEENNKSEPADNVISFQRFQE